MEIKKFGFKEVKETPFYEVKVSHDGYNTDAIVRQTLPDDIDYAWEELNRQLAYTFFKIESLADLNITIKQKEDEAGYYLDATFKTILGSTILESKAKNLKCASVDPKVLNAMLLEFQTATDIDEAKKLKATYETAKAKSDLYDKLTFFMGQVDGNYEELVNFKSPQMDMFSSNSSAKVVNLKAG